MIVAGLLRRGTMCATAVALALLACTASAFASSPWWHLFSGSRPAALQAGLARDEIQELVAVDEEFEPGASGALFIISITEKNEKKEVGTFATGAAAVIFGEFGVPEATAENVQKALEEGAFGKGRVLVSGGPPDAEPLQVRVPGHATPPLEVEAIIGKASANVVAVGRPDGQVVVALANLGDAAVRGECINVASGSGKYANAECTELAEPGKGEFEKTPVQITDRLPAGLRATSVLAVSGQTHEKAGAVECLLESVTLVSCTFAHRLPAYQQIELVISVVVESESPGLVNEVSVSGGGAAPASLGRPVAVGAEPAFGVEDYEVSPEAEGGAAVTKAGSHPFQTTFSVTLDQGLQENVTGELEGEPEPFLRQLPKDLNFKLPPGMVGNPTVFKRCPLSQFLASTPSCSPQTVLGIAMVTINEASRAFPLSTITVPLYNLEPNKGEPARFGFSAASVPVFLDTSLRTGSDYGVTTSVNNITQSTAFLSGRVTVWGVPGDPRHDSSRGEGCLEENAEKCHPSEEINPPPFFTLPTSCSGQPLVSEAQAASWTHPGAFASFPATHPLPTMDGCNRLPFSAQIAVKPDGTSASTPTGLKANVHVPQDEALNPNGLAPADVKDITVSLPEGLALSPSAADGLQACSESLIGFTGFAETQPGIRTATFTPKLPSPLEPGVNFCPEASKIGTVKITTPLLPNSLEGAVYLATPAPNGEAGMNPYDSLIAMYIIAEDPVSGSLVKLPGKVTLSTTGQVVTTFENNPQLPFEDAELHFFGGERAPLSTPARCGAYTTSATLVPWSGNEAVSASSSFDILSGPAGGPCPGGTLPFTASLTAGTINNQAGSFSPLTTTITREDGNQDIQSVQLHFPPGLSGLLSGVKLCPEQQANEGTCGPESEIGETTVSVGLGGNPFSVKGGKVYLTEKYKGAPFGLSIVNPAKAGPFDLGKVVVRAKVEVDLHTAALMVTTDPTGPYSIPHILHGIPLQIKHVNVTIARPGFTFNPTNCEKLAVTGSVNSVEGAGSAVSVPFQVANCANLKFKPKFTVSTSGKTSKANGASLSVKLAYPKAPFGSEANVAGVKVELPKQLPSRLTTLQKACTAAQFAANPAGCPAASIVGHAIVHTPLLPVPLEGPAYFVSNGGQAFPNLIMVLQGYGVTVHLVGDTFISKAGITSSTFRSTPDVPFSSFALTLPKGRFSALTANANLCAPTRSIKVRKHITVRRRGHTVHLVRSVRKLVPAQLVMPTTIVAQNGAQIHQSTRISVTGCHKAKKAKKTRKASLKKNRGKRRG